METLEFYNIEEIKKLVREIVKDEMEKIGCRPFMDLDEASKYLGNSKPTLYTYISRKKISYYKQGGKVYFKRVDLDDFVLNSKNRCKSHQEIETEVMTSLILKKGKLK
ncbi:hypothetical protein MASR1M45_02650 [Candidatus Kapaibacterium sp.]